MTTDQSRPCSHNKMGDTNSNNSAESETKNCKSIIGYDSIVKALKNCSRKTQKEVVTELEKLLHPKNGDGSK